MKPNRADICNRYTSTALQTMEKVRNRIVAIVKAHPDGIPLNKLAVFYNQKYHKNLTWADLGFKNMACLIASLDKDLVVDGGKVFHKTSSSQTQTRTRAAAGAGAALTANATEESWAATPPDKETHLGKGPPLAIPDVTLPQVDVKPKIKKKPEIEQQQTIVPNFLSGADFPALGAEIKPARPTGEKSKQREETQTEGRVFREAYRAQLREVHGANVRAVEATQEDVDDPTARRWCRALDSEELNSLAQHAIRDIASEGELVTQEKVLYRVCRLMQVPSLNAGKIIPYKIQALKDLQYTIREINMFLESTEAVTSICTLYELGQSLASLKDKKRYEELNLGPLCKLPLIHRMFKIDGNTKDDDIHQIHTVDILKQLRVFRKNKPKIDLADFMKHLADHYNCDSPYELGIRIHSVGLPISTLSKVSRNQRSILEQAREAIQKEMQEETYERLRKFKRSGMEPVQGSGSIGGFELRKKYISMTAAEVVLEVFTKAGEVFSAKMAKGVQDFLLLVSGDRLATALFQLAICGGSLAVPQDLVLKDKTSNTTEQPRKDYKPTTSLPSEATVKQYLKDNMPSQTSATSITLAHFVALEKKLTKNFKVPNFFSLEQGTFLEFLVKHIQLLQEILGFTVNLGNSSVEREGWGFRPTRQDVFEFIKQCGTVSSIDNDALLHIETALRCHYRVQDSMDLGFGSLQKLVDLVQRQKNMLGGGRLSPVYYELALLAKHSSAGRVCGSVGILGELAKTQALNSLLSCPLLEDLNEWSQWDLVFRPGYGPLKDFIERNSADTGLATLEVSPGILLRITTHTGDKLFSHAAMNLDPIGTAGHLVCMVVADGIDNVSTALLANHMESSLAAAVAKEGSSLSEDDESCYSTVARFLLACLTRIPTKTCQAVLQQVLLEPFSRVLGQAKSKVVLLSAAQSDPSQLNRLHQLGILLGITEWVKDYHKKLATPQSQNYPMHIAPTCLTKSNLIDSVSSSLTALDLSEAEDLEEHTVDHSISPSHLNQSLQQVSGDKEEGAEEDEEDEEELYELSSVVKVETNSSEAEESKGEELLEVSDANEKDTVNCESESPTCFERAIIEDIRKSEFGIGVELTVEGQKLMKVHQERLGRSLDRLSTELYSKDTHFVLELIQNADDNNYPSEAGVIPALAFVVEKDCVSVLNNESGFEERNIRAICDVGCSTKGKHKYGYIGQKGIGFKSVFKVTDSPEIHSNGFHLRFDKTCGPMGYILPHWTEDERLLDTHLNGMKQHSWSTKIHLPLRSGSHQTRNLFHDVHPSLLLFLHRLRSITIYNQDEKRLVTMTRKDLSHNMLEVEHTNGTERWLVVKATLQPKKIKEDVESTELALAFQLDDTTENDIKCQPQKQPVFAFLPLRSFGFRFIIQGDFEIPSSREDVDRDSSWNQWLRSEIPQLFLKAMDVFTAHPEFSGLKGLCSFLQFIPLPDEVLDFFKPVAGRIIQLLKGKAFLPTLGPDGEVVYKLPSQVAVCQDAVIREVIGGHELDRHLSLSYLLPNLQPAPPISLLTQLGVRYLRGSDVTTVTTAMAKELMQEGIHSDGSLYRLARLLVCNFRSLEHGYGEAESILQTLRDLPIIPLADGRVVTLNGEGVFFPMEETKSKKKKTQAQTGPLSALYKDVNVVHPFLLNCVEPLEGQQVRELLKKLGVHELEPQELLEQHIYPAIRSDRWKSKPESVVVSYLVFIKQHSTSSQEYSDTEVPVLTSRGLLCPAQDLVHFCEEYGNINLPKKLPGYDWVLLSPCYVQTDGDVTGWRELFHRLGVRDRLIIRKDIKTLSANELASSPWSAESAQWQKDPGEEGCLLHDFPCEEFIALATAQLPADILLEQRVALLQLLETNWDSGDNYSQYITAQVVDSDGRSIKNTKSSFFHFLCCLEWVPAYHLLEGGKQETKYLCPNSVYLTSSEVLSLLGTHVCYLDIDTSDFSRALGMRHSVSVDALITYLKEWCTKPAADNQERRTEEESEGAAFTSTIQHIHSVYTYLHKNCSQRSLKELFQHNPSVFVEFSRRDNGWCSGYFYHLKEVCWSDPTAMFKRYKKLTHGTDCPIQEPKVLAPFYIPLEFMKDFFMRLLNVEPSPNMNQYVGLLELVCSSCPIPNAEVLQDVSVLYAKLAQKCKVQVSGEQESVPQTNPSYCATLKGMVSDKRVFPTKDSSWVSLARRPMISDSRELEKIFKPHTQVCLLHLPPAENKAVPTTKTRNQMGHTGPGKQANSGPAFNEEDRSLFLEICGIRQLSQCVKSEAQTESMSPCPSMQALVHSVMPYIQRFIYHQEELSGVYAELTDNRIHETIKRLHYGQVGKLYIRYQLDLAGTEDAVVELQDVTCLLKDNKELYIQKDHLKDKLDICRELVKLFCTENSHRKELTRFLSGLICSLTEEGTLQRFLQKEDIGELPNEEQRWEVPKPEMIRENVPPRLYESVSGPAEPSHHEQEGGEQTIRCWPPQASLHSEGANRAVPQADGGAVEAVMKKWPPPAMPKDREPDKDRGSSHFISSSYEGNQPLKSSGRPADSPSSPRDLTQPSVQHRAAAVKANVRQLSEGSQHSDGRPGETTQSGTSEEGEEYPKIPKLIRSATSVHQAKADGDQATPTSHAPVPEAVVLPSMFQGTGHTAEARRPPLALDFAQWNKGQPSQATLEDMELNCHRPTTVVLCDEPRDLAAIGEWGEQLVNSFLLHWRDSSDPERPEDILWCNERGESGHPYDFKLTFGPEDGHTEPWVVYVEVKSTVKREKSFIHLSANELDFALKEKEHYHIFRVYSAGDAQSVRLCRIQNLAQHLHAKDLALYLFV
ncbi:uncharacterized protein LOC143000345 isoform X2 [Genypterus blacodes]|uniref:uncharacterized protein LOC143000345 isoform X2 n=1 Tax=Genypterus blacodes TaxID=154954 RepID=UPI003F75FAA1